MDPYGGVTIALHARLTRLGSVAISRPGRQQRLLDEGRSDRSRSWSRHRELHDTPTQDVMQSRSSLLQMPCIDAVSKWLRKLSLSLFWLWVVEVVMDDEYMDLGPVG